MNEITVFDIVSDNEISLVPDTLLWVECDQYTVMVKNMDDKVRVCVYRTHEELDTPLYEVELDK